MYYVDFLFCLCYPFMTQRSIFSVKFIFDHKFLPRSPTMAFSSVRDTIVLIQPDNSVLTSVYRKPTHTDLYLQWDSQHHLSAKYSVINTLRHRAKTVCSNHHLLKEEEDHLNRALSKCRYPVWALNRARMNTMDNNNRRNKTTYNTNSN